MARHVKILRLIREKVRDQAYEFAIPHFFEEMANDDLGFADIEAAMLNGRINRILTDDTRGTRYELIGNATDDRLIAVICRRRQADCFSSRLGKFMSEQLYDYGQCSVCGAQMTEQRIKQDFWIKGDLIVIEDVPAGVCPRCGEKIVKAEVGRQIATLIANPQRVTAHSISVPVIQFQAAA